MSHLGMVRSKIRGEFFLCHSCFYFYFLRFYLFSEMGREKNIDV